MIAFELHFVRDPHFEVGDPEEIHGDLGGDSTGYTLAVWIMASTLSPEKQSS
jgi:hypothetical protein